MKLYRVVDDANKHTSPWTTDYSLIGAELESYRCSFSDYCDKDRIFVESITIPDNIEPELDEVYEWENNKLTTITKNIY